MGEKPRELVIGSISAFELALRGLADRHCVFRGENAPGYVLRPRAGRFEPAARAADMEKALLDEFKKRAQPLVSSPLPSDWEWLALAERHGLATRLLEWTASPLLAAFWAVQDPYLGGDRVLYVLDCAGIPVGPVTGVSPFSVKAVTLYRPTHSSEGVAVPCGVFTLHPNPTAAFEAEGLERWLIKGEALTGICMTVDGYGTDDEALTYADLDFMCRKLNWDWEVGVLSDAEARASATGAPTSRVA
jgi:FRG domain-containing protein